MVAAHSAIGLYGQIRAVWCRILVTYSALRLALSLLCCLPCLVGCTNDQNVCGHLHYQSAIADSKTIRSPHCLELCVPLTKTEIPCFCLTVQGAMLKAIECEP